MVMTEKYSLLYRTHPIIGYYDPTGIMSTYVGWGNSSVTRLVHNRIMAPNKQEYLSIKTFYGQVISFLFIFCRKLTFYF